MVSSVFDTVLGSALVMTSVTLLDSYGVTLIMGPELMSHLCSVVYIL